MRTLNENTINKILEYINACYFNNRKVPTVREIADHVSLATSTTFKYLTAMEERGLITKDGSRYGIQTSSMKKVMDGVILPVVGEIACGTPILAEENIESYLTISGSFLGSGDYFVLKAHGNSMIKVGVSDGDYVIVRKQSTADEGSIVVAMVDDGECTLKRYYIDRKKRKIRLHPENDEMEDMYFDRVEIQGVAIKVIKNLG